MSEYGGEGEPLTTWIDLMLCRNFVKKLREPGTDHYRANLKEGGPPQGGQAPSSLSVVSFKFM